MAFCSVCGETLQDRARFCAACGIALRVEGSKAHSFAVAGSQIYPSQLIALALALAILATQVLVSPSVLVQAFLFCIVIGCVIIAARFESLARFAERLAPALTSRKKRASQGGRFSRWVVRPAYSICDAATSLTKSVSDPFVRTGLRATLWLVLGSIAAFLVLYAALIIAAIVVAFIFLYIVLWAWSKSSNQPTFLRQGGKPRHPEIENKRGKPRPGEFEQPGGRFRIEQKDGSPHLIKADIVDHDLGQLQRRDSETQEISNLFGPNVRIVEKKTIFGLDSERPYRVESEDGEYLGDLVKESLGDDFLFEPAEEE